MLLFPIFTDVLWDALEEITGRLRQGASEDLITTVIYFRLPAATYISFYSCSRFACFDSKQLNYLFAHVVSLELEIHLTRQISTLAGKNTISDPEVVSLEDIGNDFMALITLMGMKSWANEWTVWLRLLYTHRHTHTILTVHLLDVLSIPRRS